jgi:hypothetical protein
MSNLSELLPTGGGQNAVDFVASGTLSSGQTVVLKADGTVEAVTGYSYSDGTGTTATFNAGNTAYNSAVYDPVNNKVIIAYEDSGDSSKGKAIVGTVSGTSISFGTEVEFSSFVRYVSASFSVNSGKVIIGYQDRANSEKGTAIAGTVSGTSISFGTPILFNNGVTSWINVSYDATGVKTVFHFMAENVSAYGMGRVANISGASISFGSATIFNSATTSEIFATFSETEETCLVAYKDATGGGVGEVIAGTVSGTSISYGSSLEFKASPVDGICSSYDTTEEKWVVLFSDNNTSNYGTSFVASISGTTVSIGTLVVFESSNVASSNTVTYNPSVSKVNAFFRKVSDSSYLHFIVGAVSGNSITWGSSTRVESRGATSTSSAYDSTSKQTVIARRDSTFSTGRVNMFRNAVTVTNSADFIGITAEAISDTATGAVNVYGGINEAQTGLTIGSDYYVQVDGSLSTTASSVKVGQAISATTINMMDLT